MNELVVLLDIAGQRAAIAAHAVEAVIELDHVYPVPRAPEHIVGLTAVRSQSLTVIDSRRAIGLAGAQDCGERAPVVAVGGHSYALQVDAVEDVIVALSDPLPVPGGFGAGWQRIAHGVIETERGPALLLDIAALIGGPATRAA